MSNREYTLDIKEAWQQAKDDNISTQALGKIIGGKLKELAKNLPQDYKDEAEEIAENFEAVDEDVEEFDAIMKRLYDLADTTLPKPKGQFLDNKLMWIKTNF
jgi:hypothetical protein